MKIDLPNLTSIDSKGKSFCNPRVVTLDVSNTYVDY